MPFDIWWLALIAIVPQVFISVRESKERKAKGWDEDMMSYVWICFGIGIFIINLVNNAMNIQLNPALDEYRQLTGKAVSSTWSFAGCFLMFLFGYPTIVTGAIRKMRIMLAGGIFCWVSAVVAAFTPTYIDFILMAFSATMAWFIPGIILRRKYLAQKTANV
jgi:MFS family permease